MTHEWYEAECAKYRELAEQARADAIAKIKSADFLSDESKDELLSLFEDDISASVKDLSFAFEVQWGNVLNIERSRIKLGREMSEKKLGVQQQINKLNELRNRKKELNIDAYIQQIGHSTHLSRYLDSEPVEFDGDIIITDPCYVCKKLDRSTEPKWEDFMSLSDYRGMTQAEMKAAGYYEDSARLKEAQKKWDAEHPDDWDICGYGSSMEKLGLKTWMTRDTIYGDWSCTTYNSDTKEEIGQFCADAGLVSVFLLDEVLAYNPEFDYHIERPWTTTLIKNFKGTVQFIVKEIKGTYENDTKWWKAGDTWTEYEVHVVGSGINKVTGEPLNFTTSQTGL